MKLNSIISKEYLQLFALNVNLFIIIILIISELIIFLSV